MGTHFTARAVALAAGSSERHRQFLSLVGRIV